MLLKPAFFFLFLQFFFFHFYRIRKSVARTCTAAAVNILIIQTGTKRFQNVVRVGSGFLSPINSRVLFCSLLPSEAVFHMICYNMRTHPPPTQSHAAPTAEIQEMLLLFHLSPGWSLTPIEDQIQTSLTVHSGGPVFPFPGLQPQTNILHHIKACSRISWSVRYFRLRGHTVCFHSTAGLFVVNCFHFHIPVYFFFFLLSHVITIICTLRLSFSRAVTPRSRSPNCHCRSIKSR